MSERIEETFLRWEREHEAAKAENQRYFRKIADGVNKIVNGYFKRRKL